MIGLSEHLNRKHWFFPWKIGLSYGFPLKFFPYTTVALATVQVSRLSRSPVQVRKPMRHLAMEMGISIVMGVPQWMDGLFTLELWLT